MGKLARANMEKKASAKTLYWFYVPKILSTILQQWGVRLRQTAFNAAFKDSRPNRQRFRKFGSCHNVSVAVLL